MDSDVTSDQRLEHHQSPPEFVDLQKLFQITGVEYFKVRQHCSEIIFVFYKIFSNEAGAGGDSCGEMRKAVKC